MSRATALTFTCLLSIIVCAQSPAEVDLAIDDHFSIAGIYPHLAMYNSQGECGTGAVVPYAGRLWVVTYSPHFPMGSDDKLYEITPGLEQIIRPESVGGTPANRMIHRESNQLSISHYLIDEDRNVRVIPQRELPGRVTGTARHLTDPENKIYIATMEEGLYEIDVHSLDVTCWINDRNGNPGANPFPDALDSQLPGYHGKGLYTAQGALYYSNNGEHGRAAMTDPTTESGAFARWGGPGQDWEMLVREQFTEITGPGGIYGAPEGEEDTAPVWAMGWDHRSVLLNLLDAGDWHTYRLPKASFSYDGAHGWNTEWPRIREIGTGDDYLATMHGTFWHFPATFSLGNSAGIVPRSNYLKVIGDFARWGDFVVLGCDDSAQKEFLNTRPFKSEHGAPLVSNSNLWFVAPETLSTLGPALGSGGVWLNDDVVAGDGSDAYLFAGYDRRMLHLGHRTETRAVFDIEIDREGNNQWEVLRQVSIAAYSYQHIIFTDDERGAWVRVRPHSDVTGVTAWFSYANDDPRTTEPDAIFDGLATAESSHILGGVMRGLSYRRRTLGLIAQNSDNAERPLFELGPELTFAANSDPGVRGQVWQAGAPDPATLPARVDGTSILIEEDGRRWRLPINPHQAEHEAFGEAIGFARLVREVATERDMLNVGGTFYELPARNAGGFAHLRPIASHPFRIHDFCSYRGLILLTGIDADAQGERIYKNEEGSAAVWAGVVDELWRMGKPVGMGGPWHNTQVVAGQPSDPYLMYGYEGKRLRLKCDTACTVAVQVDPSGTGDWHTCTQFDCKPGVLVDYDFPAGFNAHWVRLVSDADTTASALFVYNVDVDFVADAER
ncbi:hypothetical protein OT109_02945 [Phycisphaeraceae bacterium D3-23]